MTRRAQAAAGLGLTAAMAAAWTALHVGGVFLLPLSGSGAWAAPALIVVQSWLGVGLFIAAHDAMHGSLAPGRPRLETCIGRVLLFAYAGLSYDRLRAGHMRHHKAPGTAEDPDFHHPDPRAFSTWFRSFFLRYFGWKELLAITGVLAIYLLVFGASPLNAALFWGVPSIASAVQLFVFGTWLPHRHRDEAFPDRHNARSLSQPWLVSLLTCFHFGGFHHEHHLSPGTPWWRLPSVRAPA